MTTTTAPRAAFTLLEVIISTGILSVMLSAVTLSLNTGAMFSDRVARQTSLDERANVLVNQLALELRTANGGAGKLQISAPSPYPFGQVVYQYAVSQGIKPYTAALEPFTDTNGNGVYDLGEPFTDVNGNGICDTVASWTTQYETSSHRITYDKSAGTLTKRVYDSSGIGYTDSLLTDLVAPVSAANPYGGFVIQEIGTTLQLSLTLQTFNRQQESIIYTAQSQVLFLRSSLNSASGSNPQINPDYGKLISSTTAANTSAPSISMGNLITLTSAPAPNNRQITLIFTAPIGQTVNPNTIGIKMCVNDGFYNWVWLYPTGVTNVSTTPGAVVSVTRSMPQTKDGIYTVTLTGEVDAPIEVWATAATSAGIYDNLDKTF